MTKRPMIVMKMMMMMMMMMITFVCWHPMIERAEGAGLCGSTVQFYIAVGALGPGTGTMSDPAASFSDLLSNPNFNGANPVVVNFIAGPSAHQLPVFDYANTIQTKFTDSCGITFRGEGGSATIAANFGLLLTTGYGSVVLEYLNFINCVSAGPPGGAVRTVDSGAGGAYTFSTLSFTNCSSPAAGGAVYFESTAPFSFSFGNCDFVNCEAGTSGGAVWAQSSSDIESKGCTWRSCNALSAVEGGGGAAYLSSGTKVTFADSTVNSCSSLNDGGGMYLQSIGGSIVLESVVFDCNAAAHVGGAALFNASSIDISNATFHCNSQGVPCGGCQYFSQPPITPAFSVFDTNDCVSCLNLLVPTTTTTVSTSTESTTTTSTISGTVSTTTDSTTTSSTTSPTATVTESTTLSTSTVSTSTASTTTESTTTSSSSTTESTTTTPTTTASTTTESTTTSSTPTTTTTVSTSTESTTTASTTTASTTTESTTTESTTSSSTTTESTTTPTTTTTESTTTASTTTASTTTESTTTPTTTTTDSTTTASTTGSTTTTPTTTSTALTTLATLTTFSTSTSTTPTTSTTTTTFTAPPTLTGFSTSTPTTTTTTTTISTSCLSVDTDGDGYPDCEDECPNNPSYHVTTTCECYAPSECEECTENCTTLEFGNNNNNNTLGIPPTTLVVGPSTVSYTVGNVSYECGWGAIRELRPSSQFVKGVDTTVQKWTRLVTVNRTQVVAKFKTVVREGVWANDPITVTLLITFFREGGLFANQNSTNNPFNWQNQPALKFSVAIDGNWSFETAANRLHVDFYIGTSFKEGSCGKEYEEVNGEERPPQTAVYELFGDDSRTRVSLLEYGYQDGVEQPVKVLPPFLKNGTAQFELVFLTFRYSLVYDPSFAVLLGVGASSGECESALLQWILPVAFLAGAGTIILTAIALGSTPWLRPYVLGPEGNRVHTLRSHVSSNSHVDLQPELPISHPPPTSHLSDW